MSHAVYKYPFQVADKQALQLPVGAKILHVEVQQGTACIWALVDTEAIYERREFRIFGTGHPITDLEKLTFLATFFTHGGAFVWHLFEERS